MSTDNKNETTKPQLTRLQLDRVWFTEEQDFPGGNNSITPSLIFGVAKQKNRQYFLGWFVPSFQVVQIEWYQDDEHEPELFSVPMSSVKRVKHSARKP